MVLSDLLTFTEQCKFVPLIEKIFNPTPCFGYGIDANGSNKTAIHTSKMMI